MLIMVRTTKESEQRIWFQLVVLLLLAISGLGLTGCSGVVSGNSSTKQPLLAPSLTIQPSSQAVTTGQPASFSVAATGTAPLSYQWKKNGAAISGAVSSSYTTPATTSSDNGAQFTVVVSNTVGNVTSSAAVLTVSSGTTPPSVPTGLSASAASSSQIDLTWSASTGSVAGYKIFRGGNQVGTSTTTSYSDTGLSASTTYSYTVAAYDAAGNTSAQSSSVSATTLAPPPPGSTITSFQLSSPIGGTLPFTVGLGFRKGDAPSSISLGIPDQQVIIKRTWSDGSAKTAIVSGRATLSAGTPLTVNVLVGGGSGGTAKTCTDIQAANPSASVQLGSIGTVTLSNLLATPFRTWVSGPEMVECHYRGNVGSDTDLDVWFYVRLFADGRMWVRTIVYNSYLDLDYDASGNRTTKNYVPTVIIGGTMVYNNGGASLTNYQNTSWTVQGWIGGDPQITAKHDMRYLEASKLVPNYMNQTPSVNALNGLVQTYTPMNNAGWTVSMGQTGFQNQIGLLPLWDALDVTSNEDSRAWNAVQANAQALYSYPITWHSSSTHLPFRPSDFPTWGFCGSGCGGATSYGAGPLSWDVAHHGSGGYLAYLITGDYFYLEEMEDQSATCYVVNAPNHGSGTSRDIRGDVQDRAVAWCTTTVSQLAGIGPSGDSIVSDYQSWLSNGAINVLLGIVNTPGINPLGYILGYPANCHPGTDPQFCLSPFEEHFNMQALGMGRDIEALPDLTNWITVENWFDQAVVGILGPNGASNYCFANASPYNLTVSSTTSNDPTTWLTSWGAVWSANNGGAQNTSCGNTLLGGSGGDPANASTGYWGNLMPAIAYATDHGVTGALASWARLTGATNWSVVLNSGFGDTPMWGIVPR
jgi:chitodextrinase